MISVSELDEVILVMPSLVRVRVFMSNVLIDAERRKETHYRDRAPKKKFGPFALETYGALTNRSDRFLVECATLASRECAGSGPPISLVCTWFRQRVSIALQ